MAQSFLFVVGITAIMSTMTVTVKMVERGICCTALMAQTAGTLVPQAKVQERKRSGAADGAKNGRSEVSREKHLRCAPKGFA